MNHTLAAGHPYFCFDLLLEQPWEVPVNGILKYMKVVLAAVFAVSEVIVVGCGGVVVHSGDGERL